MLFYRYFEHRFGRPYVWPPNLIENPDQPERESVALTELRNAFWKGEIHAWVYRPEGAGDGLSQLTAAGWRDPDRTPAYFMGGPIESKYFSSDWQSAEGLTPFVDLVAFDAWLRRSPYCQNNDKPNQTSGSAGYARETDPSKVVVTDWFVSEVLPLWRRAGETEEYRVTRNELLVLARMIWPSATEYTTRHVFDTEAPKKWRRRGRFNRRNTLDEIFRQLRI